MTTCWQAGRHLGPARAPEISSDGNSEMQLKPDKTTIPKNKQPRNDQNGDRALVAGAVLKAGGKFAAAIAAVLGIAGGTGLGDEVVLFALGGVCFALALTLSVVAYLMTPPRRRHGDAARSQIAGSRPKPSVPKVEAPSEEVPDGLLRPPEMPDHAPDPRDDP
jgi:hypothetical protein